MNPSDNPHTDPNKTAERAPATADIRAVLDASRQCVDDTRRMLAEHEAGRLCIEEALRKSLRLLSVPLRDSL
jgi:hypothetical protein